MNNYKSLCFGILGIVLFFAVCAGLFYMAFYDNNDYYSVIDNSKYVIKDSEYRYTLKFYDNDGDNKMISFNTTRELKEGRYIKVNYMRLRGVTSWEEVMLDDMPLKVREKYDR